eukprot:439315-Pleurochrysis_carterae.AAC.1
MANRDDDHQDTQGTFRGAMNSMFGRLRGSVLGIHGAAVQCEARDDLADTLRRFDTVPVQKGSSHVPGRRPGPGPDPGSLPSTMPALGMYD